MAAQRPRMERTETADGLIIGSGPAAFVAAIAAAREGLSTHLLCRTPGQRLIPGEALHPGIEPVLQQLGINDVLHTPHVVRIPGIIQQNRRDSSLTPFGQDEHGPWLGFQVDRHHLHQALYTHASRLGVHIHHNHPVTTLELPDRKHESQLTVTSRTTVWQCRFLIDASGASAWSRRQLGTPSVTHSQRLVAWVAYVDQAPTDPGTIVSAPTFEFDDEGWTWTARLARHEQWVRLRLNKPQRDDIALDHWRRDRTLSQPPSAHTVTWQRAQQIAVNGLYRVGDAACVVDPASSHGVQRAVMSAMMAVHCAKSHITNQASLAEAAAHFQRWVLQTYDHDRHELMRRYTQHGLALRENATGRAAS